MSGARALALRDGTGQDEMDEDNEDDHDDDHGKLGDLHDHTTPDRKCPSRAR